MTRHRRSILALCILGVVAVAWSLNDYIQPRLSASRAEQRAASKSNAPTITLAVEGMVCTGCEQDVKDALAKLPGVSAVAADHKTGIATLTCDPANLPADADVLKALAESNHEGKITARSMPKK